MSLWMDVESSSRDSGGRPVEQLERFQLAGILCRVPRWTSVQAKRYHSGGSDFGTVAA